MSKKYKNAFQRYTEIPGNENKTELDFIKQLDKEFLKKTANAVRYGMKQVRENVLNIFQNKEIKEFFKVKNNYRHYVIYKTVHVGDKKFFICTDRKLKNLFVLDGNDGMTIFDICTDYEIARKAFSKTIKKTLNGDCQFSRVLI